jgi:hypothetical protein
VKKYLTRIEEGSIQILAENIQNKNIIWNIYIRQKEENTMCGRKLEYDYAD